VMCFQKEIDMDNRVRNLKTVDSCAKFRKNALRLGESDLAQQAQVRAIEIRAELYGCQTMAEKLSLEAVYAYEAILTKKNGKTTRASRTWQMIKRHGIIEAVERAVNRESVTQGYTALVEMGLEKYAFEAVILKYPKLFSIDAVKKSEERMNIWLRT
ncbi:hypothetical protein, partial [Aliivibrio fischeri]